MLSSKLDQDAQIASGENQLKSFGNFLEFHDKLLPQLINDDEDILAEEDNRSENAISLDFTSYRENISIFQLINSDNKILNKIITTFVQLCNEVDMIVAEGHKFQLTFLYMDEDLCTSEESGQTEQCFVKISQALEFLCNVQYVTQRCIILASTILQQLGTLFTEEKHFSSDLQLTMQYQAVFNRLGDVIVQLIIFDEILSNSNFSKYWPSYKKTVSSVGKNLDKFNVYNVTEITGLTNVLNEMEMIFSGNLFQTFLDSMFKIKEEISAKALGGISLHFQEYIKVNMTSIERFGNDVSEFDETDLIIKMNAICVLFHNFFGHLEQKSFKHLIDSNVKHTGITLVGNIVWCPEPFLKKHAETLMKNYEKNFQDSTKMRQTHLQAKIQNLVRDTKQYCIQISLWNLQMNAITKSGSYDFKMEHYKRLCALFLQGLQYAGQISHMIKSVTNLHVLLHTRMHMNTLQAICKLIEYLKIIQATFYTDIKNISKTVQCVIQYLTYKTLFMVTATKKKISTETYNEHNLDTLSALQITEKCLYGPATKLRILIATLAINSANPTRTLSTGYLQKLHKTIHRLNLLCNLQKNLDKLCDSTFIYWHQSIISVYLKQIVEKKTDHNALQYIIQSTNCCDKYFKAVEVDKLKLPAAFKVSNYNQFREEIIEKLCGQIETFLRVEVHANLQQDRVNPLKQGLNDYRELVNMAPVQINGQHIVLKAFIENYLSNMFYNLTTISLHDWKTYGEMRHLGNYKFHLNTIEDHLPTQTLEQGIDVLEIMRNIHIFVSKYLYNMNNQIFIECSSNNKHLNTIGIKHIANSLRTHGTGIINTTVNFTYQFLRKKFYTFSQFMYDEQIKSRLMKDLKYFRDNKEKSNQMYSFERADSFNKGIRKLGLTSDGQSFLDLFRQLISHIGNAMGYIRLIRSGGIHASSSASVYLPKFDESLKFFEISKEDSLTNETIKSAENFENNIRNLSRNFSEGTEYFRLLVDAFSSLFRDPKNIHLRNFYLIVPPLTINFVEYILNAKEKINKKDKHGVLFVDDGFAIGLAYILKLLNQMTEFNSLHWFKSVRQKYAADCDKITAQRKEITTNISDDKLHQTLTLTEKRIKAHLMEYNLLYYNLTSSKIFF